MRPVNKGWKQLAEGVGCLLILAGIPLALGILVWLFKAVSDPESGGWFGMVWLPALLLVLGGGTALHRVARDSLAGVPSNEWNWPSRRVVIGIFVVALVIGELTRQTALRGLFFPPAFVLGAILPPLAAVAWACWGLQERLTERRLVVALMAGAMVSATLAFVLGGLASLGIIFLTWIDWFAPIAKKIQPGMEIMVGERIADAVSSSDFFGLILLVGLLVPLIEGFVKPLPILPLVRTAGNERQAFLLGATAGAGLAIMGNLLYTGVTILNGWSWIGLVLLRVVGAAVHPLAGGLVALGWYEAMAGTAGRGRRWFRRFVPAVGLHLLWNSSQAALAGLLEEGSFGRRPPEGMEIVVLGILLVMVLVCGAVAWLALHQVGRLIGQTVVERPADEKQALTDFWLWSDRAIGIWAVLCLLVALSVVLFRGWWQ
jgi:hypothetical protein